MGQALRDLARFASVPFPERALSDETRARLDENNRRAHLLESFAAFGAQSLLAPSAQVAHDYLEARGFSPDMWANLPLGFFPSRKGVRAQLQGRGFSHEKIEASGAALGVRSLVVCLDNDSKPDGRFVGQEGALYIAELALVPRSVRNIRNVDVSVIADVLPIVDVLPPVWLEPFKDADAFVRAKGLEAFERLLPERQSAVTFVALTRLEGISPASPEAARRGAVETLLQLDVRLSGPRAPLDRDELRQLAGLRTGFLPESLAQIGDEWARLECLRARKRALETWARNLNRGVAGANEEEIEPLLSRVAGEMAARRATEKAAPLPFFVARLDEESRRQSAGKSSGWAPLDALGVRFGSGEFALIGARTGHGKTSFLVALLQRWLREENDETLLFFSLEEPEVRIYHRLLSLGTAQEAAREGVRQGRALAGWMVPQVRDWTRDARGRGELYGPPDPHWLERARDGLRSRERQLQIVSNSDWGLDDMEAYARQLSQKRVLGAVFVDYLQRVAILPSGRQERRDQEVSAIGRRLKTLAVDIGAPVIAGAPINREAIPEGFSRQMNGAKSYNEARKLIQNARPELHHLREGGSEREADLALGLLSYGADYRGESPAPRATRMEVGTLKNRNGEPGKWATLAFEGRTGWVRKSEAGEEL